MRLNIDRNQFLKALLSASKAISSKNPMPILDNVKLDLTEKGLEVTGTNGEITVRSTVPYMIGDKPIITNYQQGATLVNAYTLTEGARKMEGETVSFDVIDNSVAKIGDNRTSYKLNCISADEYPDIVLEAVGKTFTVKRNDFASLVEQCAHAAAKTAQDAILTAISLTLRGGTLSAIATDSARVATKKIAVDSDLDLSVNIPAKSLLDIVGLFEGAKTVDVAVSDKQALFSFDGAVVSSRLIPGTYPNLSAAFPKIFNYVLQVNSQEFLSAIERVSVLSNARDNAIKLLMSDEKIELSIKNREKGSANEEINNFRYTGERMEVAINSLLVSEAIKALRSEDIELCFQTESRPFIVRSPSDDSSVELITPLHVY